MEKTIQNKWFIFFKYLLAALLVLASVLALVSAWYASRNIALNDYFVGKPIGVEALRISCLVLGFTGTLVAIFSFANSKKPIPTIIGMTLVIIFTIALVTLASLIMATMDYEIILSAK